MARPGLAALVLAALVLAALVLAAPAAMLAQTRIPAQAQTPAQTQPRQPAAATGSAEVLRPTATLGPAYGAPAGSSGTAAGSSGTAGGSAGAAGAGVGGAGVGGAGAVGTAAFTPPRFPGMARFLSVARPDVVLYDAPSDKARKLFLAPPGMPVEVVSVLRNWVKVRDAQGDLTWVVREDLSDKRMVVANAVVPLRREPQPMAAAWFNLDQGVVVELLNERPTNGFVQVKYADGQIGWLAPGDVWGL